jgi:nucleoid-associated protein YejK
MNHSEQDFWLRRFDQEDVQFVVLSQSQDKKLVKTLRRQPGWSVDFEEDGAVIFTRSAQKEKRQ